MISTSDVSLSFGGQKLFDGEPARGELDMAALLFDLVQASCGYAVPYYPLQGERPTLTKWANNHGETGVKDYWKEKNTRGNAVKKREDVHRMAEANKAFSHYRF